MKKCTLILLTTILLSHQLVFGQSLKKVEKIIGSYYSAETDEEMIEALNTMINVSDQKPELWQSSYWASYFSTQVGRKSKESSVSISYYDQAQEYLERSQNNAVNESRIKSDHLVLQGLIHSLKAYEFYLIKDYQKGRSTDGLMLKAISDAHKTDPKNPRVYLMGATNLISDGRRDGDRLAILAGKYLLDQAEELFATEKPDDLTLPNWGSNWIGFWKEQSKLD